jgi:hypothetical protein
MLWRILVIRFRLEVAKLLNCKKTQTYSIVYYLLLLLVLFIKYLCVVSCRCLFSYSRLCNCVLCICYCVNIETVSDNKTNYSKTHKLRIK